MEERLFSCNERPLRKLCGERKKVYYGSGIGSTEGSQGGLPAEDGDKRV